MLKKLLSVLFIFSCAISAYASQLNSPTGEWFTISDKTHDRAGLVKIYSSNGKLYGRVIKVFPGNGRSPNELCTQCTGNLKNRPVQGLQFLWGFVQKDENTWTDGQVLDPKNGKIYKGSMKLINDGKKLELRGYWGIFYRSQTWIRAE